MALAILERQTFPSGSIIFREGEVGDRAYIVEAGAIEIFGEKDGRKTVFGVVGKGGIFGEMALIDNKPRMGTARTTKGTTLIVVSRSVFREKLARTDPFLRKLLHIFVDNIRGFTEPRRVTNVESASPAINRA